MDDDDLFGVFEAKPKTFSTSAPPAPTSIVEDGETATGEDSRKRKKEEDGVGKESGAGDLEKDDDEEEEGAEPPVKRRVGGEELCPAAGEGSVIIHDITSFNPELGRKAHRHQVRVTHVSRFNTTRLMFKCGWCNHDLFSSLFLPESLAWNTRLLRAAQAGCCTSWYDIRRSTQSCASQRTCQGVPL